MISPIDRKVRELQDRAARHLAVTQASARWRSIAHEVQIPPPGAWDTYVLIGGRGSGKTRGMVEWGLEKVRAGHEYGVLVGRTVEEAIDIFVYGESGFLRHACPEELPDFIKSERYLRFPNGAIIYVRGAKSGESCRGLNTSFALLDELGAWVDDQALKHVRFGLRLGQQPQLYAGTTWRKKPFLKDLVREPGTVVRSAKTRDNEGNLAPQFLRTLDRVYGGTRLAAQELEGLPDFDLKGMIEDDDIGDVVSTAEAAVIACAASDDVEAHDEFARAVCAVEKGRLVVLDAGVGKALPDEIPDGKILLPTGSRSRRLAGLLRGKTRERVVSWASVESGVEALVSLGVQGRIAVQTGLGEVVRRSIRDAGDGAANAIGVAIGQCAYALRDECLDWEEPAPDPTEKLDEYERRLMREAGVID